jgi:hypothetical protein
LLVTVPFNRLLCRYIDHLKAPDSQKFLQFSESSVVYVVLYYKAKVTLKLKVLTVVHFTLEMVVGSLFYDPFPVTTLCIVDYLEISE